MLLDEIANEVQGKRVEEEKPIPNAKEYVKIKGIWQYTNMSWYVDKDKMNKAVPKPYDPAQTQINAQLVFDVEAYHNYQCVAHVHHWKTELEEYCRVDEEWKCVRCGDCTPESIQSMIKLYRPLKDVNLG